MEIRDSARQQQIEQMKQLQQLQEATKQWEDPEYVWKRKWQEEYANSKDEEYTHGGGPFLPRLNSFRTKLWMSCCLFALIWGVFQLNHPLVNQAKSQIASALNKPFDFQNVAFWYERQFGGNPSLLPAWIPAMQQEAQKVTAHNKPYFSPVQGKVIAPFESSRLGVTLETKGDAVVSAIDTGLVIYKGNKDDTGYTIIIRHADGMQSNYGWIEQASVELNDWIKGGEKIGTVSKNAAKQAGYLYFAVSKDNRFLNPVDVVAFD
ncbi:M23 family metallopeptidase [Paenibacillus agricola]|uniref:M23 family metallopeptidase n=1 Tax=Paenibacillus agricola TaxID=2716264 RepID=A0ABX0J8K1_9BACL|nr:M23 family metallopeptidase [Paenibacillus agricola]NHN30090.1 M23 family metallopeptidase [Paenibacillus agricola]